MTHDQSDLEGSRRRPAAVVRGIRVARLIEGGEFLFKARNYMGPVRVDAAACSYRWFRLKMTTRPWMPGTASSVLDWKVPPAAVRETDDRISVRAYDMVGVLVFDPRRIRQIDAMFRQGASVQQLLDAFNRGG